MKYLAVDFGLQRCGIAVTDTSGALVFARKILDRSEKKRFWREFLSLLAIEAPQAIIVGLPLYSSGNESLTTRQARNFVKSLQRRSPLPMYLMEETLSSYEAELVSRESGLAGKNAPKDHIAAARILESFLNLPEAKRIPA